jgi:hypothetical protein
MRLYVLKNPFKKLAGGVAQSVALSLSTSMAKKKTWDFCPEQLKL